MSNTDPLQKTDPLDILYEDNHLLVINKRPGDIVQGDKTGDEPLNEKAREYIRATYAKPGNVFLGTVHRIDRPVSGVVIFAKTGKALSRLNQLFQEKSVKKTYWAIVRNKPAQTEQKLTHYLIKNQEKNKSKAFPKEVRNGKKAELEYRLLLTLDRYYLLEIHPHTGRHHQIRVQLAAMGCPIKGDLKYGYDRPNEDASIHLHARKISFVHPVKKTPVEITAPPPDDVLWNACQEKLND